MPLWYLSVLNPFHMMRRKRKKNKKRKKRKNLMS
jgi:preprotein translocase subunit YajC